MPYASVGYPNKISEDEFKKIFPADFIGEGLDQTRGWFYTLNVIATALFDETPYKNLIVNGLVLAEDGSKMSKSKKNYPDPSEVISLYGADSIRLYLMNSPLVKADKLKFSKPGVYDVLKRVFIPWFNVLRFLLQNIQRWEETNYQSWKFDESLFTDIKNFDNTMDRWILASNQELIKLVRQELDAYRLSTVLEKKLDFLEQLSNWYVKLNRNRLKGSSGLEDWNKSLNTLFYVLMNSVVLMAPYVPFIVESFYQNLRKCLKTGSALNEDSIHFLLIPEFNVNLVDENLVSTIDRMQRIIACARNIRDKAKIPVK
jgi:isoleucyl-tRNA synthetase